MVLKSAAGENLDVYNSVYVLRIISEWVIRPKKSRNLARVSVRVCVHECVFQCVRVCVCARTDVVDIGADISD